MNLSTAYETVHCMVYAHSKMVFRDYSKHKVMSIANVFIVAFNFGTPYVNSSACFSC